MSESLRGEPAGVQDAKAAAVASAAAHMASQPVAGDRAEAQQARRSSQGERSKAQREGETSHGADGAGQPALADDAAQPDESPSGREVDEEDTDDEEVILESSPADDEDDDEPIETFADWNVPSWQEIVASLYRPDR